MMKDKTDRYNLSVEKRVTDEIRYMITLENKENKKTIKFFYKEHKLEQAIENYNNVKEIIKHGYFMLKYNLHTVSISSDGKSWKEIKGQYIVSLDSL